jgi:hypothetical protein
MLNSNIYINFRTLASNNKRGTISMKPDNKIFREDIKFYCNICIIDRKFDNLITD